MKITNEWSGESAELEIGQSVEIIKNTGNRIGKIWEFNGNKIIVESNGGASEYYFDQVNAGIVYVV